MFCKHDWKVLSDVTMESPFDTAIKALATVNSRPKRMNKMPSCRTTQVIICSCNKCGKIKKFTTMAGK